MNGQWEMVETNIWKNTENPRKYKVILYYGRDSKGKMKKSSKVVNGTLKDARNTLILHESGRIKQDAVAPTNKKLTELVRGVEYDRWWCVDRGDNTDIYGHSFNHTVEDGVKYIDDMMKL